MRLSTFILKCFENLNLCHSNLFRISTCPLLPEMPAHKVNALSGVGRRVFEFRISPSLISGLNITIFTTFHFANLEYKIYETGHYPSVIKHQASHVHGQLLRG
jgi:hypothetical protein